MPDVTIPALGMAMTEAILTRWYKEPGDAVTAGEVIAEIETDKSTVDLEATADGVLGAHLVAEGAAVPVGAPVTSILDATGTDAQDVPPAAEPRAGRGDADAAAGSDANRRPDGQGAADGTDARPPRAPHALSPRQRRQARLAAEAAAETSAEAQTASEGEAGQASAPVTSPSARHRTVIAERVSESWRTIPHFTVQREIDAREAGSCLAAMRARQPLATYTDLLLRAFALALGAVADAVADAGDVAAADGDVGLAVATPDGVMMPVIPSVPSLDMPGLIAARAAAVKRAREGRLSAHDLASKAMGSLSNLGARGVDAFTGIVPLGQRFLLTTGRVTPRPVVVDGQLAVRPTLVATLNVDHRYLDGDQAADLLEAFGREFGASRMWAEEGDR